MTRSRSRAGGGPIVRRPREGGDAVGESGHLPAATGAAADVPADLEVLRTLQRAEQMLRQELAHLVTRHVRSSAIVSRRRRSAVRIRVLAVPIGMPSSSATSALVLPPK